MISTGTTVSVDELVARREPMMLTDCMPVSGLASGADWAKADGAKLRAAAPYRLSRTALRSGEVANKYLSHEKFDSIQIVHGNMGFPTILRANFIYCCFAAPSGFRSA
jgi:hypothetical protein